MPLTQTGYSSGGSGGRAMTGSEITSVLDSHLGGADWRAVVNMDLSVISKTTTSEITEVTDKGKYVRLNNASAITLTVSNDSDENLAVGTVLYYEQMNNGQVTVVAGSGVTINGTKLKTNARYSVLALTKVAANTWTISGDLVEFGNIASSAEAVAIEPTLLDEADMAFDFGGVNTYATNQTIRVLRPDDNNEADFTVPAGTTISMNIALSNPLSPTNATNLGEFLNKDGYANPDGLAGNTDGEIARIYAPGSSTLFMKANSATNMPVISGAGSSGIETHNGLNGLLFEHDTYDRMDFNEALLGLQGWTDRSIIARLIPKNYLNTVFWFKATDSLYGELRIDIRTKKHARDIWSKWKGTHSTSARAKDSPPVGAALNNVAITIDIHTVGSAGYVYVNGSFIHQFNRESAQRQPFNDMYIGGLGNFVMQSFHAFGSGYYSQRDAIRSLI